MGIQAFGFKLVAGGSLVKPDGTGTTTFVNFLLSLFNRTGAGTGTPNVASGLTVIAGTPFVIGADWNQFTTVPAGGQAQLPALPVGTDCIIYNDAAAHSLGILPQPTVQIDALGAGAAYTLAHAKMQWFRSVTPTLIHSSQYG